MRAGKCGGGEKLPIMGLTASDIEASKRPVYALCSTQGPWRHDTDSPALEIGYLYFLPHKSILISYVSIFLHAEIFDSGLHSKNASFNPIKFLCWRTRLRQNREVCLKR